MADLDASVFEKAARAGVEKVAAQIARDARRNASLHELKGSRWGYRVVEDDEGVRVLTYFPFAHIDEFGSARHAPTGALRSAAAAHGQFMPSPK
jgi:hypothetical protein